MNNDGINKLIGMILILASFFLPITLILINQDVKLDYSFGFTMGAMFVAGIMMCA